LSSKKNQSQIVGSINGLDLSSLNPENGQEVHIDSLSVEI